jgi:O-antigen/teichoic acid export membrane protein
MSADNQHGRSLIAKNTIFNLLGQVMPMVAAVVTIPYIVKGLGTNGYGILSIAFMLLGYFSIFDLGLSRATVKFVAENLSPEKIHKVPELVWTSLTLLVGMGCLGGFLAALFVPVSVTHFFKMPPSFVGEARTSLFILCASMPIMLANDALRGVLEASQRFDLVNYVKVPSSVTYYLAAALVIALGVKVTGIVTLMVLIRLISTFAYLFLCIRVVPGLISNVRFSRASMRPLATFGGWIMISNITNPVFGYLERFMIATLLSVGMLTYYSVPYDLVSKMIIFPACIVPSLFPYFSYHGSRKSTEVSEVTSRTIKYLLLVLTPIAAVFFFFAKDILQLWLGTQFAVQSAVSMQIVTLIFFFNAFAMVPFTSVQALGRPDLKAILDVMVLPAYALLAWWLMRRLGINGAALAKLVITIADVLFLYAFASKLKAFSFRDCVSGPLSRALMVSCGLFVAVLLIQTLRFPLIASLLLVVVCVIFYVGAFWVLAVDKEDRITISSLVQRAQTLIRGRQPAPVVQMTGTDVGA